MTDQQYEELKKEIRSIKRGSNVQTAALLLIFFFGISSIADLIEKLKKQ